MSAPSPALQAPRRSPFDAVPPVALVVGGIGSVQFGAALAATLFDELGAAGTVMLRIVVAAVLLGVLSRPRVQGRSAEQRRLVVLFGFALAGMNLSFYEALDRIPLGVAVTLEMVGPLTVAVATSRRALDLVWVAVAAAGILLLSGGVGSDLDGLGVLLAFVAGGFWAAYILLSARSGAAFSGGDGLALAMAVGAALLLPVGLADGGSALLQPELLALGASVAVLSSVIPYTLELEALRRMPTRLFGVLMSLEPGVAALAGYVVLDQRLSALEILAIVLVVLASVGATRSARREHLARD